jgi:hypothetical protein
LSSSQQRLVEEGCGRCHTYVFIRCSTWGLTGQSIGFWPRFGESTTTPILYRTSSLGGAPDASVAVWGLEESCSHDDFILCWIANDRGKVMATTERSICAEIHTLWDSENLFSWTRRSYPLATTILHDGKHSRFECGWHCEGLPVFALPDSSDMIRLLSSWLQPFKPSATQARAPEDLRDTHWMQRHFINTLPALASILLVSRDRANKRPLASWI